MKLNKNIQHVLAVPVARQPFKNPASWRTEQEATNGMMVPWGSNIDFVACYLYVNGPSRAATVLRALEAHNGLEHRRSRYTNYFYFTSPSSGRRWAKIFPYRPYNCRKLTQPKSPLWEQTSRSGPWQLTVLGLKRVADIAKR